MPREEVDDTDMTPAEFRAAAAAGLPVRVVTSRQAYDAELGPSHTQVATYGANIHLSLALAGPQPRMNTPARATS